MMKSKVRYVWILALFLSAGFMVQPAAAQVGTAKSFKKGMVVSATRQASEVGTQIMQQGGNAVDAAVAVNFALAVTFPVAGNIGGGGFMVIRMHDGTINTLDFRETAPGKATRTMYQDDEGNVVRRRSRFGSLAVGVPGAVDGMVRAIEKYGNLDLRQVLEPSIKLARDGYKLSYEQARDLNGHRADLMHFDGSRIYFTKPDSTLWHEGDLFVQKDLAETLERIAGQGRDGFYSGKTADLLVKEMQKQNGLITKEDLANYRSVWRDAVKTDYKGYSLYIMPPPSSGSVAIAQILNMIEPYDIGSYGYASTRAVHLVTEAERRAFADRAYFLGDPDFVDMPVRQLISKEYAKKRMASFSWDKATPSSEVDHGEIPGYNLKESFETTHYSVVDPEGNAVAVTTTLNSGFGSKVSVSGAGFLLNNEMDDFSAKPGVPNQFGLIGGEANAIQPNKRMLSSMSPTIVTQNGELRMVLGSPGGSTIITTVLQVFLNVAEYGMNIQQAVAAPRVHHQWLPEQIFYDDYAFDKQTMKELKAMGHKMGQFGGYVGRADCIFVDSTGTRYGGADPRGEDWVSGY